MDRRRTITLSVKDDFSRQLLQMARQMNEVGDATEKAGRRGVGSFKELNSQMFYIQQNARMVYGSMQSVVNIMRDWGAAGAQAERSAYALEIYAGSAQEAEKWTRAITEAMRDTVTEGEAAAQAFMLMKFGLADSAEEAGEFARMLSVVAAANPQLGGTQNALAQIQLTIANMSFMRLDQLGLSVVQVKDRMKELQAAMPGLSQEAAFQEAVMEGLTDQANKLGDGMADVTIKQDQLAAKSREFKERFGSNVNDVLERAAGAALDLWKWFDLLSAHDWLVVLKVTVQTIEQEIFGKELSWEERIVAGLLGPGGIWAIDKLTDIAQEDNLDFGYLYAQHLAMMPPMTGLRLQEQFGERPEAEWGWGATGLQSLITANQRRRGVYDAYGPDERAALQAYAGFIAAGHGEEPQIGRAEGIWPASAVSARGLDREVLTTRFHEEQMAATARYEAAIKRFRQIETWLSRAEKYMRDYRAEQYRGQMQTWRGVEEESMEGWGGMRTAASLRRFREADFSESWHEMYPGMQQMYTEAQKYTEQLREMAREAARAKMTLEELWGLDPTTLGASIYQHGVQALRDYGIEGDKAEEAMRYLAITTGTVNSASEIFRLRALGAAEALERNELTVEGYAIQIGLLAREDWTWVDKLVPELKTEEDLRRFVELIDDLAAGDKFAPEVLRYLETWGIKPQTISDLEKMVQMLQLVATGDWGAAAGPSPSPFKGKAELPARIETDIDKWLYRGEGGYQPTEIEGKIYSMFVDPMVKAKEDMLAQEDLMYEDITNWVDGRTLPELYRWSTEFSKHIAAPFLELHKWMSRPWTVTITSLFTAGGGSGGGGSDGRITREEFQHGGYTGDGSPNKIAGLVHKGEYVISQDMLRKMKQGARAPDFPRVGPIVAGGGGGGVTISGPVHVHGVQNPAQLLNALEREAGRRNTRLGVRL